MTRPLPFIITVALGVLITGSGLMPIHQVACPACLIPLVVYTKQLGIKTETTQ